MSIFRRAAERRGTPADLLVVGLGNPGPDYAGTRHNVGAEVVEQLARRHGGALRAARRENAVADVVAMAGRRVVLAVPQTYVNLSGEAVSRLVHRHGIDEPSRVIVVHDELDLPVGRMKVKVGGGVAGHNGLRSIASHLGSEEFTRVRVGVDKPPHARAGKDYVLRRPGRAERDVLDDVVERAADAVESLVGQGTAEAMNRFNAAP
jgi:peptidyl-tRNA hydrolase, PTH1 family